MFVFSLWNEMHKRSSFICTRILHSACSWKTALPAGRLRSIVRPIWFTCQLQRDAPGDQERSATSFLTGKVGNSLQQLVFSAFLSCCVCDPSLSPSGGLSWLCPEHLPALGFLLRSSLHFFSHLSYFLEEFRHIIPAFKVSHIQMLKFLIYGYH